MLQCLAAELHFGTWPPTAAPTEEMVLGGDVDTGQPAWLPVKPFPSGRSSVRLVQCWFQDALKTRWSVTTNNQQMKTKTLDWSLELQQLLRFP